ncbi:hypothetical protein YY92_08240 [Campylobacter fetus]|uniref:hypothetical protein n=1 Tax=Campylobacter fetus TaxID=196 RepID=UPI0011C7E9FB|nr:hypothetical protein [Campylobacter fetus]EAJ1232622.1 hypothetical protein [Campylobacter fetus]EAK0414699.1 hypothetical protein [Campylobacter fetus]TXF09185.1 hypothetical protein FPD25_03365 [Campylobacter fetus subsp. fetus]
MSFITKTLKSSGYFAINKHLMRVLGLNKAIVLSLFIDKADYYDNQIFFYTIEDISDALGGGLSEREIRATIKSLIDENLLIDKGMIGIPAKRFFMINEIKISELFDSARDVKNDMNSPCKNDISSPCKNDSARDVKNDRANIINPHITNPNNINPHIQEEKNIKKEKSQEQEQEQKLNIEAFEMWCKHKGAKYSKQGRALSKNKLMQYPKDVQLEMVEQSIMNGWSGLFELKNNTAKQKNNWEDDGGEIDIFATGENAILSDNWITRGLPAEVLKYNKNKALENQSNKQIGVKNEF